MKLLNLNLIFDPSAIRKNSVLKKCREQLDLQALELQVAYERSLIQASLESKDEIFNNSRSDRYAIEYNLGLVEQ